MGIVDDALTELLDGREPGRGFTPPRGKPCLQKGCVALTTSLLCERHIRLKLEDNLRELGEMLVDNTRVTGSCAGYRMTIEKFANLAVRAAYGNRSTQDALEEWAENERKKEEAMAMDRQKFELEHPHACPFCRKRYVHPGRLALHVAKRHGNRQAPHEVQADPR